MNAKRLGLLRELVPAAARVAMLMNPINAPNTSSTLKEVEPAARALGLQIQIFHASTGLEIDAAFAALVPTRPDALFVAPDGFFTSRRVQLPRWLRATRCQRAIRCVTTLRSVD